MNITYTFPADFKHPKLAGVTCTGGKFVNSQGRWREAVDAVAFSAPVIDGKGIAVMVAGRPGLEALLAEHIAAEAEKAAQKKAADEAYAKTPRGQRAALVTAEYNTYNPEAFPGSAEWRKNAAARDALDTFDAAHPELVAELEAEAKAAKQARYDALSDFVKNGS